MKTKYPICTMPQPTHSDLQQEEGLLSAWVSDLDGAINRQHQGKAGQSPSKAGQRRLVALTRKRDKAISRLKTLTAIKQED